MQRYLIYWLANNLIPIRIGWKKWSGPVRTGYWNSDCSIFRAERSRGRIWVMVSIMGHKKAMSSVRESGKLWKADSRGGRPQGDCSKEVNSLMWSWETKWGLFPLLMASYLSLMTSGNEFRILSLDFHGPPEWPDNKCFFTWVAWIESLFLAIHWFPNWIPFYKCGICAVSSGVQVLSLLCQLAQCFAHGRKSVCVWQCHDWFIDFSVAYFKATTDLIAEVFSKMVVTVTPILRALQQCDLAIPLSRDGIEFISLKFGLDLVTPYN